MFHLFKSAAARTWTYSLIVVVVVGLLIGAVRLTLPFADLFRSQIAEALGETLGLEVSMGRFQLRLAGMVPRVTLRGVDLRDPKSGEAQLQLKRLHLDLDLTASLRTLAPQVESLTLVGARLQVERHEDGSIAIAGLDGVEAGDPHGMAFFLGNGRFLLADSEIVWVDDQSEAPPVRLADVNIRFDNEGSIHRVGLNARIADDPDTRLRLSGDLRGQPDKPDDWSGDLYLDWHAGDVPSFLRRRLPEDLQLRSSSMRLQNWNRIADSRIQDALLLVDLGKLEARTGKRQEEGLRLRADRLGAQAQWLRRDDGWRLELSELTVHWASGHRSEALLGIDNRNGPQGESSLEANLEGLTLTDLREPLTLYADSFPVLDALHDAGPSGDLHDLRLFLEKGLDGETRWTISGELVGLHVPSHDPLPGVSGLNARFSVDKDGGQLRITGQDLRLDVPQLFEKRAPIALDRLTGTLRWESTGDGGFLVQAEDLALANPDLQGRIRGSVELSAEGEAPRLEVYGELTDIDAERIDRYLPVAVIKPKLRAWLDQAFLAGRVPQGTFLFEGNPSEYPFRDGGGRFETMLTTEDATLSFHPLWPPLEALDAVLRLRNDRLDIHASGGRLLDLSVIEAHAVIPDLLDKDGRIIRVQAAALGAFANGLAFLRDSPLKQRLGTLADLFHADGTTRLDLGLTVPLHKRGPDEPKNRVVVTGALSWPGPASLTPAGTGLELTALSGALSFDQKGLLRSHVEADLWGSPIAVDLDRSLDDKGVKYTELRATGRTPVGRLSRQLPGALWQHLKGTVAWDLDLAIPNAGLGEGKLPLDFSLTSKLRGVAVDLPAPLGKNRSETRSVRLDWALLPGEDINLLGSYGDQAFALQLARDDKGKRRLQRGGIVFGASKARLPERNGIHLSGRIASLDLPAWIQAAGAAPAQPGAVLLRSADLRVEKLLFSEAALHEVNLDLTRKTAGWSARFDATEVAGRLFLPHRPRSRPLRIDLDRLDLEPLFAEPSAGDAGSAVPARAHPDPRRSHTLDLSADRLHWGENQIGRLTLAADASDDGLRFREIGLDGGSLLQVSGSGRWTVGAGGPTTLIDLKADTEDLGNLLRQLGYESLLDQAPAEVELRLRWPGSPGAFSVQELGGRAVAEIKEGSLLDVDPGVGRMLGVFNLGALNRRLSLDFRDLFGPGYAFERISGKMALHRGQAEIEEMTIEGPSAEVRIEGKTDLVKQEFEQVVTVTPHLGTGVALASAVAGGPLVGAAVLIADKVSGGAVDKIGQYQYDVTGPWTNPSIERRPFLETRAEESVFPAEHGRAGARRASEEKPPGSGGEEPAGAAVPKRIRQDVGPNLFLDP